MDERYWFRGIAAGEPIELPVNDADWLAALLLCSRLPRQAVGAEYCVTSCDLAVFADKAAEPIPPGNAHIRHGCGWIGRSGGWGLVQRPVRPVAVVVIDVLAKDQPQVPFAGDQHPVQALTRALAIQRSAIAFARGAMTGIWMIRTPIAVNTVSNAAVNLVSRSRIRNFRPSG